ncbi:MAG TPA: hypothetical protein VJU87_10390 [Gemmatimonadaceae bacterium]|nr:hypothetical protein [Gemmatimonadaceae bacterium]
MKQPEMGPAFDHAKDVDVLAREQDTVRVSEAMERFLADPQDPEFQSALASFVRAAQRRGEPIEQVLAALRAVADAREPRDLHALDHDSSKLHDAVLDGVLLAFYGKSAVREQEEARKHRRRRQRKDVR